MQIIEKYLKFDESRRFSSKNQLNFAQIVLQCHCYIVTNSDFLLQIPQNSTATCVTGRNNYLLQLHNNEALRCNPASFVLLTGEWRKMVENCGWDKFKTRSGVRELYSCRGANSDTVEILGDEL